MKRILTTGLVLFAMTGATASFAQSNRTYDDDIYYNSKKVKQTEQEQPAATQEQPVQSGTSQQRSSDDGDTYTSSGDNYDSRSNARSYDEDYVSYDDEYSYSTQINRFNYPFYNRPYWSTFYNPNWYDPYWVDPYWGWNPWARPGFSISIGGGPYWSSYWGWQSWYGYGGFNSYYGSPGYGLYGGFYSGYWNGYYAGLYNNYGYGTGRYRAVTYGPRYSLDARNNNFAHNVGARGFRREMNGSRSLDGQLSAPRANGMRSSDDAVARPMRDRSATVEQGGAGRESIRNNDATINRGDRGEVRSLNSGRTPSVENAPRVNRWNDGAVRNEQATTPAEQPRRERGGWFGSRGDVPARSMEQPRVERSFSQPRVEQRSAPAPRMEAPSRSFGGDGGGSRGGFRGGRR